MAAVRSALHISPLFRFLEPPLSNERVFTADTTKNCLSLMASCGLYDFSGEFAFTVGLPAKLGVSGALFITIPGVCGIAIWSPRLDALGNSVRGVEFARRLAKAFAFDGLPETGDQIDPRRRVIEAAIDQATYFCAAAAKGDLTELRRLVARSVDVNLADYDGRTALHLAASDGHADVLRYLLPLGAAADSTDRWGNTPLDDARRNGDGESVALLQPSTSEFGERQQAEVSVHGSIEALAFLPTTKAA
jgi:glutaminase